MQEIVTSEGSLRFCQNGSIKLYFYISHALVSKVTHSLCNTHQYTDYQLVIVYHHLSLVAFRLIYSNFTARANIGSDIKNAMILISYIQKLNNKKHIVMNDYCQQIFSCQYPCLQYKLSCHFASAVLILSIHLSYHTQMVELNVAF